MARDVVLELTGHKALDRELAALLDQSTKGVKGVLRGASRDAAKKHVLPKAKAILAKHRQTGNLASELKVRAIKRSRTAVGVGIGFPDPLFVGDTFYAGFLEYGTDEREHKSGKAVGRIRPDSFLRKPLYESEAAVRAEYIKALRERIAKANAKVRAAK